MEFQNDDLNEFLVINVSSDEYKQSNPEKMRNEISYKEWTAPSTRVLLDLYKKYRHKVGTFNMKNLKQMWKIISEEMLKLNLYYSAANCENRWKVLERNYKKFVDNSNKTGRGRKYFEFQLEMDEIFNKKRNIFPHVLLTANSVITPMQCSNTCTTSASAEDTDNPNLDNNPTEDLEEQVVTQKEVKKRKNIVNRLKRSDILQDIKNEMSKSHEKKVELLLKKMNDKEKYYQNRLDLEKSKLEEMKKFNNVLLDIIKQNGSKRCQMDDP